MSCHLVPLRFGTYSLPHTSLLSLPFTQHDFLPYTVTPNFQQPCLSQQICWPILRSQHLLDSKLSIESTLTQAFPRIRQPRRSGPGDHTASARELQDLFPRKLILLLSDLELLGHLLRGPCYRTVLQTPPLPLTHLLSCSKPAQSVAAQLAAMAVIS